MHRMTDSDWELVEQIGHIQSCNPFLEERLRLEKSILGDEFRGDDPVMSFPVDGLVAERFPNTPRLGALAETLVEKAVAEFRRGEPNSDRKASVVKLREQRWAAYQKLVVFYLYVKHLPYLDELVIPEPITGRPSQRKAAWRAFRKDFEALLQVAEQPLPGHLTAAHTFAVFFQVKRAFRSIFECIIGRSMPVARLRAAVWESIFTHDLDRYSRGLYRSMTSIPTLIVGPSGTGKELIAQAIGTSQYIPFDEANEQFPLPASPAVASVNLSALSPTLIESELFGHRKGAFTGALTDRKGWLEVTDSSGAVFLDEIGELDASIQVKLLRLLQSRTFQPVGDTEVRYFQGKLIAATNRELGMEIQAGRFREDFYYRLCADQIRTPSLREQFADRPEELSGLVEYFVRRLFPLAARDTAVLTADVVGWIRTHLNPDYSWPGNVRELEQCIRNIVIRQSYTPAIVSTSHHGVSLAALMNNLQGLGLSLDELTEHYISFVYAKLGRYDLAAEQLRLDWRTVKQKINPEFVARYRGASLYNGPGEP